VRPAFRAGGAQPANEWEPIAPLKSGISDERIGSAPIGGGCLYLRLSAVGEPPGEPEKPSTAPLWPQTAVVPASPGMNPTPVPALGAESTSTGRRPAISKFI